MSFHDFTLFVVLSLFTEDSPNANQAEYFLPACVGGTRLEKKDDNR